jgi:capsular polysaccharide biosynthesis protein
MNRPQIEDWFSAHGFEIFDFGELPFKEQITLMRGAEVVVGPDGSNLWLTFFARPDTRIGIVNNPYLEEHWFVARLSESLGHRLSILTGDVVNENRAYRKFSDYRIEVDKLSGFLDGLLAVTGGGARR